MSMPTPGKAPKGYSAYSTQDPQQAQLYQQLIGQLIGQSGMQGLGPETFNYLSDLLSGSPESFDKFAAPFMRQFNEQTIPGIAERFTGLGAGAQSSSAFQQALGQAGAGLQENLASLRGQLQQSAVPYALNSLQNLLNMQTFGLKEKQRPWWQGALTGIAGGIGQGIGGSITGGIGSGLSSLGSLFKSKPAAGNFSSMGGGLIGGGP